MGFPTIPQAEALDGIEHIDAVISIEVLTMKSLGESPGASPANLRSSLP